MGKPMVRNLVKAGYQVVVHNRSQGAIDELTAESDAGHGGGTRRQRSPERPRPSS